MTEDVWHKRPYVQQARVNMVHNSRNTFHGNKTVWKGDIEEFITNISTANWSPIDSGLVEWSWHFFLDDLQAAVIKHCSIVESSRLVAQLDHSTENARATLSLHYPKTCRR